MFVKTYRVICVLHIEAPDGSERDRFREACCQAATIANRAATALKIKLFRVEDLQHCYAQVGEDIDARFQFSVTLHLENPAPNEGDGATQVNQANTALLFITILKHGPVSMLLDHDLIYIERT